MNFKHWKSALKTDVTILNFMVIPMLVLDLSGLLGLLLMSISGDFGIFAIGIALAALLQMLVGATQFIMTILWVSRGSKKHTIYLIMAIISVLSMFILGELAFIIFILSKFMGYGYWIWNRLAYQKVLENNGDDYGMAGQEDLLDDIPF